MLYTITVQTHPEGQVIGSMGEFFYREKAEKEARKHSWDMGPNFLIVVTKTAGEVVKSRKAYRYGRVFSLRRT